MTIPRYFWITDPHLNFLSQSQVAEFFLKIKSHQPTGVFLTGDISTGKEVVSHLKLMSEILSCPIYFVLGNHDFYHADLAGMKCNISALTRQDLNLHYLSIEEPIALNNHTAIIGHDGWYDSGWRKPLLPIVFLADWYFISDFRFCDDNAHRKDLMKYQAEVAAQKLKTSLEKALEQNYSTIYLLTHFPPWPEKIDKWGGLAEKFWAPYNSCKITAEMLLSVMEKHPSQKLIILAGHTHRQRYEQIVPNIELKVGDADHGRCQIQDVICL